MKKILVIEDNDDVRENTAEILGLAQYEVLTAPNGKIGVEMALANTPDLIVCDIMMPVLDGYGVIHLLSKNPSTNHIPFIFLTAKAERRELRKGMDMGADDYLTKPFDDIELLNAIESRLKKEEFRLNNFSSHAAQLSHFIEEAASSDKLLELTDNTDQRQFDKKEHVYREGTAVKGIYLISKGRVKTYQSNEQGKELITGIYGEGEYFGYVSLLKNEIYEDTAMAMEDTSLCFVPKDDFHKLMYRNPEVAKKFIGLLSNQLVEREHQLLKLAYNSVRKRVADALVDLNKHYNKTAGTPNALNISRDDLAELAGTATETTIRTLSDFKAEGLIEINGSAITLLFPEKLAGLRN